MDNTLICALQNPKLFDHPTPRFQVFETHISWVLLTGPFAYKFKKPINFGFLDFSTLEKRKFFCEEEIRLNRRLSPTIYNNVVAICGTPEHPNLKGDGPVIEYAVKMREFEQTQLLDNLLVKNLYTESLNLALADIIAEFHSKIERAPQESHFGTPERVKKPVRDNYEIIRPLLTDSNDLSELGRLQEWAEEEYHRIEPLLAHRKRQGYTRECHGDLHLGNIARVNDEICVFDCIEFNENYRWVDVMSDAAFLYMDLKSRGQESFAAAFINRYLERTGDYESLALFCYYTSYRAMVRAKINMLRRQQTPPHSDERSLLFNQYKKYFQLAKKLSVPSQPILILMYGVSGSGKSTVAQKLVEQLPAIRLRSDVERKRLFGLKPEAQSRVILGKNLYTPEIHFQTFQQLLKQADTILQAGYPVIVDATFLKQQDRLPFEELALSKSIPWQIVHCNAPREVLEQRIKIRTENTKDPSEATVEVLEMQLKAKEPLSQKEQQHSLYFEALKEPFVISHLVQGIKKSPSIPL